MNDIYSYLNAMVSGAESRMPKVESNSVERMLRGDLAYARKQLRIAREEMQEAMQRVAQFEREAAEATRELINAGYKP